MNKSYEVELFEYYQDQIKIYENLLNSHNKSNTLCNICIDESIQILLIPCKHASLCINCSKLIQTCPICYKKVENKERIYII